jgi:TniQ
MKHKLRLRVDPPYLGESLSSFLERAAQFYALSFRDLCVALRWPRWQDGKAWTDIDFNPPIEVLESLEDSVTGWRSPIEDHRGFNKVVIGQSWRHAYCPRCFLDDLGRGRTPYFRNDWAPFFVSTCWQHGSLLLSWHDVDCQGRRRLPKAWLYRLGKFGDGAPRFFWAHLEWLGRLDQLKATRYGVPTRGHVVHYLSSLQKVVEKSSASPLEPRNQLKLRAPLREDAQKLAEFAVREIWGIDAPYGHGAARSFGWNNLQLMPVASGKGAGGPPALKALRRSSDARWRRSCLLFVARTLAGTEAYGSSVSHELGEQPPWRQWWGREVFPLLLGLHHRLQIEWHMDGALGQHLDGVARMH